MQAAPLPLEPGPAVVSAALTETNVRVNSDFRGDRIVLYGAVFDAAARPSDVVVIVRGPDQPVRIARHRVARWRHLRQRGGRWLEADCG